MSMTSSELNSLVESWLAYCHTERGSPEHKALSWVVDREWELTQDEPLQAWAMILEILKLDSSNKTQERLSAGPLEDILAKHGPQVIELVESEAKRNPTFAKLLGGVWKNAMKEEVWTRVQAVWDRRGWDEIPEA